MKLTELRPQFRQGPPEWGDVEDYAKAIAIEFDCPGCAGKPWRHRIFAPFLGRGWDLGPAWSASGSGYDDLTFSDAPGHSRSIRVTGGCKSHFNVTSGGIDFYGDSGHTAYQPEERSVTEDAQTATKAAETETKTADPQTDAGTGETTHERAPAGHTPTNGFRFIGGRLHQLFEGPPGKPPAMVAVPGTSTPPGLLADIEKMIDAKLAAAGVVKKT